MAWRSEGLSAAGMARGTAVVRSGGDIAPPPPRRRDNLTPLRFGLGDDDAALRFGMDLGDAVAAARSRALDLVGAFGMMMRASE